MTKSKCIKPQTGKAKLPVTRAENQEVEFWASQSFEAIALPSEPMSAEACRSRDMIVRMALAVLGKSSDELHVSDPTKLEAALEVMETSKDVAQWMRTTAEFLDTAGRRLGCVVSKAFTEHPEWASLKSAALVKSVEVPQS